MTLVERRSEQDPSAEQPPSVSETLKSPVLKRRLEIVGHALRRKRTYIGFTIASTTLVAIGYWAYFKYRDWKFRKSIDRDD